MSDEMFGALAHTLVSDDGTTVYPKGDGRVEIPHGIVRLMGWRDKCVVWIWRSHDRLVLSDRPNGHQIGRVSVSMERARIPMSMLRTVGMDGRPLVVSPELTSGTINVRPSLVKAKPRVEAVLREMGPEMCAKLAAALSGDSCADKPADPAKGARAADPKLFLMDTSGPTVIRVIGAPFVFNAHWVPVGDKGRIVPHRDPCPLCSMRTPDKMFLIPVVRKKGGETQAGFLLAQEDLRANIARQIAGRNPTEFDLILFYKPYSDGMCGVYKSPVEPMPESQMANARSACADPNAFVASTFHETDGDIQSVPGRAPMFIAEGHFSDEAKPRNLAK
jgi:hypothetical protein